MKCALPSALSSLILASVFIAWCQAETENIIEKPYKNSQSKWIWSWNSQWTSTTDGDGKVFYQVCDVKSANEPNKWIRSNVFLVGDAKRIDVTVQYAVSKCSSVPSIQYCKEHVNLYVYKTAIEHSTSGIPEPWVKPKVYHLFGTTFPKILDTSGSLSRSFANNDTYSFLTNSTTRYYYIALQYRGGCFELYSVTISYSVCPSLALPTGLIQLPKTIAPANGTIRVPGSCAANAQPLADNATLYGNCKANGEWIMEVISDQCLCKAGYGRYLNGSGAVCKDCPPDTYQNAPASKPCKPCPLNSVQDSNKKECICERLFYRTNDETIFDNCTGQPSEPRDIMASFINATLVVIQWKAPSDLGGRTDDYYQVECRKCGNDDKNCTGKCDKVEIIHSPKNSRKSTVKHLSVFTYYQFKVFSMNGVTQLAEKNGEKPKYAKLTKRTSESVPGVPLEMTAKNCPKTIHNIMLDCWEKDKNNRPKFSDIVKQLDELIRSPEKISDQPASRFLTNGEANFGEVKSVEDWLTQIKMDKYADLFKQAGYVNLEQVKSLEEDDLKGLGIQLIGHRNKMRKSIKAMKIYDDNKA
ncbi:Ephrin type-B receptor 2 [Exaiptasia diaphana]|nr:Ephrin type-B receptor 2 [Exaiptasia diaphana]